MAPNRAAHPRNTRSVESNCFLKVNLRETASGILATLAAIILAATASNASGPSLEAVESGLHTMGITVSRQENNGLTTLTIDCNEATAVESIPALQAKGVMNPNVTRTQVNLAPVSFSTMVALLGVVAYIQPLYHDSKNTNQLTAKVNLLTPDDYGHLQIHPLFSFSFSRDLFNRIDWDNFEDVRFPRVAAHFKYSQWFKDHSENELR